VLRFKPDDWLEGLARPLLMVDPAAGLYVEGAAPDWRFAAALLFGAVGVVAARGRLGLSVVQSRGLLSLLVMLYVWTFAIGNGRYFAAGLLLIGPVLLLVWRWLPGTKSFKALALAAVVAAQLYTVQLNHLPNPWGMVQLRDGPALDLAPSPLREQPKVFLTVSGISYSILVPLFHPQSRWANIAGQRRIEPGLPEHARLQELLEAPLPKYVIVPTNAGSVAAPSQPSPALRDLLSRSLAVQGLKLGEQRCEILRSRLVVGPPGEPDGDVPRLGFMICPVVKAAAPIARVQDDEAEMRRLAPVFERVERQCPRFFPPGGGTDTRADGQMTRHYVATDTRVHIDEETQLLHFRYFRSLNATRLGTVDQVLAGQFEVPCRKLPGRYQPPWDRD
jgi:hypothetical protein